MAEVYTRGTRRKTCPDHFVQNLKCLECSSAENEAVYPARRASRSDRFQTIRSRKAGDDLSRLAAREIATDKGCHFLLPLRVEEANVQSSTDELEHQLAGGPGPGHRRHVHRNPRQQRRELLMIRLDLSREPAWLDLGHGVRLKLAPLTTALMGSRKRRSGTSLNIRDDRLHRPLLRIRTRNPHHLAVGGVWLLVDRPALPVRAVRSKLVSLESAYWPSAPFSSSKRLAPGCRRRNASASRRNPPSNRIEMLDVFTLNRALPIPTWTDAFSGAIATRFADAGPASLNSA